jgi:hypothetical protein
MVPRYFSFNPLINFLGNWNRMEYNCTELQPTGTCHLFKEEDEGRGDIASETLV